MFISYILKNIHVFIYIYFLDSPFSNKLVFKIEKLKIQQKQTFLAKKKKYILNI